MGFMDKLGKVLKSEGKDTKGLFLISTRLDPFRLRARANNFVDLTVNVKNVSNKDMKVSVLVKCPRELGLTSTSVQKSEQKKLDIVESGEQKKVVFRIHGFTSTPQRDYKIPIVVYSHFKDYEHVENAARKFITLRAV